MRAWSAASIRVTHEPLTEEQTAGSTDLGVLGEETFGVWEITPGVSTDEESDEVAVILTGRGRVEDLDTGMVVELTPGTILQLAAGQRTRWIIDQTLRKVYVVSPARPAG